MTALFMKSLISTCTITRKLLSISNIGQTNLRNSIHSVISPNASSGPALQSSTPGNSWSLTFIRTNVRNNFPRPCERKRLRMSFWNRMKTRSGRAILMRRYLKGRHVLSH